MFAVFILAMATYSSGESSKPHSPQREFILGESKEAKRSLAQKDEAIRQLEERLQRLEVTHDRSTIPTMKSAILIDILQEVLPILTTMKKKVDGGGIIIIMKIGAKMWQSLIFHL